MAMVPNHNKYSMGAQCSVMQNHKRLLCSRVIQGQNDKIVQSWPIQLLRHVEQISCLSARDRANPEKGVPHVIREIIFNTRHGRDR